MHWMIIIAVVIGIPLLIIGARIGWALWMFSHWDGR